MSIQDERSGTIEFPIFSQPRLRWLARPEVEQPAQVQAFRNQLSSVPGPKILVATGDNFGPDLGARTLCNSRGELIPKQRSAWPGSDNVASFFRMLGFTAMVPGKLDFYYGPERLRLVARYLANNAAPGHPVQMLGANLTIETSVIHPPAETPKPAPSTNYSTVLGRGTQFHFPKALLPYIREFDIDEGASVSTTVTSSSGAVQSQALTSRDLNTPGERNVPIPRFRFAWFCKGELGDKVQISPACRPLVIGSPVGTTLPLRMPDDWPRYPSHGSPLSGGTPAYICASSVDDRIQMMKGNTLCSGTFRAHIPLFQAGDDESNPLPYAITPDGTTTVFGVVDPTLASEIGELNLTWRNTNPEFAARLQVSDPLDALSQVLQTCDADPRCRGTKKILLAQVPVARAQRISTQLKGRFLAIITQAEAESETDNFDLVDHVGEDRQAPLVLVPGTNYSEGDQDHLSVKSQVTHLELTLNARTVQNTVQATRVAIARQPFTGNKPLWRLLVQAGLSPAPGEVPDYKAVMLNSVLSVMRQYCKADVALLQHRDLFLPVAYAFKQPGPEQLQQMLDELVWKGDLVTCRSVSGKVLADMKAESDRYDSEDQDRLSEPIELGRGLDYLGIFQGESGSVIDGNAVNPGDLYPVAMTDYLGLGDTGYSSLHDASVPAPQRLIEMKRLDEVSALLCGAIANSLPEDERLRTSCRKPADPETYLDQITMAPFSNPTGVTWREKLAAWTDQNWASHDILAPVKKNHAEVDAQNRRVLSVRLDRADFGFQQNLHSLSESQQQNRFGGVQAAEPTAPEKYDLALDWLLRMTSSGKDGGPLCANGHSVRGLGCPPGFLVLNSRSA